ncbi:MAG: hypothetical protein LBQ50_07930, partial [Planctomycetaceae bacterium]|nr:hypothetical protein [Planctomycetaceae bacterium]
MQTFFDALKNAKTEEDVKHVYATHFGVEYVTSDRHDLYTPRVLFEFKYDKHFDSIKSLAQVLAQTLYYVRKLKYSRQPKIDNCVDKPIPPTLCLADRSKAVITETITWKPFYDNENYDWDLAPSIPDPVLVDDLAHSPLAKQLHIYHLAQRTDFNAFDELLRKRLDPQQTFGIADKKIITEENFEEVYEYWNNIFGDAVRDGFKTSRYFVSDIQEGNTWFEKD